MTSAIGDIEEEDFELPEIVGPPQIELSEELGDFFNRIGLLLRRPIQIYSEELTRAIYTPIRPGKEGNFETEELEKIRRVAVKILIPAGILLASAFTLTIMPWYIALPAGVAMGSFPISLALLGAGIDAIGDAIKPNPFTHLKGEAQEKEGATRLMTFNVCMLWGGIPTALDGFPPPAQRMEQLNDLIKTYDPDILVLQEMAFNPALTLYHKIKSNYAHFYTRIGPNPPMMESGLFLASKTPILKAEFLPFPNQFGIKRGAFYIETPIACYFTTHMEYGTGSKGAAMRAEQLNIITNKIAELKAKIGKPCFLMGDLNIDRFSNKKEYNQTIGKNNQFHDPFIESDEETCTNVLKAHLHGTPEPKTPSELEDYILFDGDKDAFTFEPTLIDTYADTPLSDHKALLLEINKK